MTLHFIDEQTVAQPNQSYYWQLSEGIRIDTDKQQLYSNQSPAADCSGFAYLARDPLFQTQQVTHIYRSVRVVQIIG
jgi:hypothetical protein